MGCINIMDTITEYSMLKLLVLLQPIKLHIFLLQNLWMNAQNGKRISMTQIYIFVDHYMVVPPVEGFDGYKKLLLPFDHYV